MILLNPGPTNTRESTKYSQYSNSDICHRTDYFMTQFENLKNTIISRSNFATDVALIAGSGTTALEAMISSVCPDDTVVINAGKYGQRAVEIFKSHRIKHNIITSFNSDDLIGDANAKYVFFVENETSTCENYSLKRMAILFPNAKFFIDATSSFGASDYKDYSLRIGALSFCSNKCLQSTPGLGIVLWDKSLDVFSRGSYFLSLEKYGLGKLPFTVPVQSVFALIDAMKHNEENNKVFNERRNKLIKDMEKINITCVNKYPANSIIGFAHPKFDFEKLSNFLLKSGIVIYSDIEGIKNSFRLSTMSCKFDTAYDRIIQAFKETVV